MERPPWWVVPTTFVLFQIAWLVISLYALSLGGRDHSAENMLRLAAGEVALVASYAFAIRRQ